MIKKQILGWLLVCLPIFIVFVLAAIVSGKPLLFTMMMLGLVLCCVCFNYGLNLLDL